MDTNMDTKHTSEDDFSTQEMEIENMEGLEAEQKTKLYEERKASQAKTFIQVKECVKNTISIEKILSFKTEKGNTQNSERGSIDFMIKCFESLNYTFEEAGSQQSKDFRNVNNTGLNIEIKKTDTFIVYFNDTLPNEDIYYIIFFTGKKFKKKPFIPPQILFINGHDLVGDDLVLALEYQKEIEEMRDKWSRKGTGRNATQFKHMSVCPRATYRTSIEHLLNSLQSFVLKEEEPHSLSV